MILYATAVTRGWVINVDHLTLRERSMPLQRLLQSRSTSPQCDGTIAFTSIARINVYIGFIQSRGQKHCSAVTPSTFTRQLLITGSVLLGNVSMIV